MSHILWPKFPFSHDIAMSGPRTWPPSSSWYSDIYAKTCGLCCSHATSLPDVCRTSLAASFERVLKKNRAGTFLILLFLYFLLWGRQNASHAKGDCCNVCVTFELQISSNFLNCVFVMSSYETKNKKAEILKRKLTSWKTMFLAST